MKNWNEMTKNQKYGVWGGILATIAAGYYYYSNGYFDKWKKKDHISKK